MPSFDHFNLLAPIYDRVIKPPDPKMLRWLADLPIEGRLLDVGGGTGRSSQSLKGEVSSIVIADVSLGMLAQAMKKDGMTLVCSNSEQLPFAEAAFERVIMVDALHHVYDYRLTLDELWRVVKPGGRIVIEEPDIRTWQTKIIALVEKVALMRSHFIAPPLIVDHFRHHNSSMRSVRAGSTCWIMIDKRE
ncbi:MAG: class I SAM-dependent methyltransferase [Acidobacteriaceae bacterium]